VFATSDSICSSKLAEMAMHEVLKLPLSRINLLKKQDPRFFA
jgi:hypothetical protein